MPELDGFPAYLVTCATTKTAHPEWRWGQTLFNVLRDVRPELAEHVRGTELDPFYRDSVAPKFLVEVEVNW